VSAYVVVDIETTGKNALADELLCVGIGRRVYPAAEGRKMARALMLRPGTVIVAHTNFDLRWLMLEGARIASNVHYHDTKVMAWMLDGTQPLDLESLTAKYCGYVPDKRIKQIANAPMFRCDDGEYVPMADAPWDQLEKYNRSDLKAEGDLYEVLRDELRRRGLWHYFLVEEAPFSRLLIEMEAAGMPFDRDEALRMQATNDAEIERLERALVEVTGAPNFNVRSKDQVARFLYTDLWEQELRFPIPRILKKTKDEKRAIVEQLAPKGVRVTKVGRDYAYGAMWLDGMGLRPPKRDKKQKTPRPSVSSKKLLVLHGTNPWIQDYIGFSKHTKLQGYLRDWIERCHEGRLYGRFDQSGTATGRLSAREPNLQQVATEGAVRDLFRGPLFLGDYSGLEVRLSAHFSHDPVMMDIFATGGDLYGTLAAKAWGGPPTKANENRALMKVVMLGSQYGAAGETLAFVMAVAGISGVTPAKADAWLKDLKATLPRLFEWREEVIAQAEKDGYVETLAGRRRQLAGIDSADWQKKGRAERQAVNTVVQGSAADIVRRAMLAARDNVDPEAARMCLQVHDEIHWLREKRWNDDVAVTLTDICQHAHGFVLDVPLIFESGVAESWGAKGEVPAAVHEALEETVA
jgi:DNA polymerase I-like protein with 3'-5' exonuclease and polymerase domains